MFNMPMEFRKESAGPDGERRVSAATSRRRSGAFCVGRSSCIFGHQHRSEFIGRRMITSNLYGGDRECESARRSCSASAGQGLLAMGIERRSAYERGHAAFMAWSDIRHCATPRT